MTLQKQEQNFVIPDLRDLDSPSLAIQFAHSIAQYRQRLLEKSVPLNSFSARILERKEAIMFVHRRPAVRFRRARISITQVIIEADQLTDPQITAIAEAVKVFRPTDPAGVVSCDDVDTTGPQKHLENSSSRATGNYMEGRNPEEPEAEVARGTSSGLLSRLNRVGTAALRLVKDVAAELIASLVARWLTHS